MVFDEEASCVGVGAFLVKADPNIGRVEASPVDVGPNIFSVQAYPR